MHFKYGSLESEDRRSAYISIVKQFLELFDLGICKKCSELCLEALLKFLLEP